jgi:hypothetical protein
MFGQASIERYVYDGMGNRLPAPSVAVSDDSRTERIVSVNGRYVPVERSEERVIRSDGQTKIVERTIQRFDQQGHLAQTERIIEEQISRADGGRTVRSSVFRTDVNGNQNAVERTLAETRATGGSEETATIVERPGIDGVFKTAERRTVLSTSSASGDRRETSVYRVDDNGRLYEALREEVVRANNVETASRYEGRAGGGLNLYEQSVTTTRKADGVEFLVTDTYAPLLKQQQITERRRSKGVVTERLLIREPSLADPDRLGPARLLTESVCRGKCEGIASAVTEVHQPAQAK